MDNNELYEVEEQQPEENTGTNTCCFITSNLPHIPTNDLCIDLPSILNSGGSGALLALLHYNPKFHYDNEYFFAALHRCFHIHLCRKAIIFKCEKGYIDMYGNHYFQCALHCKIWLHNTVCNAFYHCMCTIGQASGIANFLADILLELEEVWDNYVHVQPLNVVREGNDGILGIYVTMTLNPTVKPTSVEQAAETDNNI
jgi:hypothetical protein